ncbi:unnamed protein product [Phytophthora fragariaefolia]|uniref:Unnamed protein product n=1 Tax=Phytophthora fragariaefolia TaxID=1490495 RepID=A0A9W7D704_9STRA|nr:unnamed protein product [Phytophthora fragariaefolia]
MSYGGDCDNYGKNYHDYGYGKNDHDYGYDKDVYSGYGYDYGYDYGYYPDYSYGGGYGYYPPYYSSYGGDNGYGYGFGYPSYGYGYGFGYPGFGFGYESTSASPDDVAGHQQAETVSSADVVSSPAEKDDKASPKNGNKTGAAHKPKDK